MAIKKLKPQAVKILKMFHIFFAFSWIIGGIALCLLIFIVSLIFIPRIGKGGQKTYWKIGILWIVLTIAFETIFGLVMGNSFDELLKAYDITTGNLWLLIVLFIGIAPYLTAKIKQLI